MSGKNKIELWATWEVTYAPYASELRRIPFDKMMNVILDALSEHGNAWLTTSYGDIGLSGQQDKFLEFTADEKTTFPGMVIDKFMDDIAAFLGGLGFQGSLTAKRISNLMEIPPELEAE